MNGDRLLQSARKRILRLLTYRARSRQEIADYLERNGFSKATSDAVITEMQSYGYIDDQQFTIDFVSYRKSNGYGPERIRYELKTKGIDKQTIETNLAQLFESDETVAIIKNLLQKRSRHGTEDPDNNWKRRQIDFLRRRGFKDNLIICALKEFYNQF